ncbi:MAG TPA: hypothetical protein VNT54_03035 [Solirubrobacteraceae bacterium]|nr:hypothetical protein [Solirubrobacteraceae bacterium]
MTSDRSNAYGRVMQTMADVGPSKLLPSEQERLREAADTLLFCESVEADALLDATRDAQELIDRLVECGRWSEARARRLSEDLAACGPQLVSR